MLQLQTAPTCKNDIFCFTDEVALLAFIQATTSVWPQDCNLFYAPVGKETVYLSFSAMHDMDVNCERWCSLSWATISWADAALESLVCFSARLVVYRSILHLCQVQQSSLTAMPSFWQIMPTIALWASALNILFDCHLAYTLVIVHIITENVIRGILSTTVQARKQKSSH